MTWEHQVRCLLFYTDSRYGALIGGGYCGLEAGGGIVVKIDTYNIIF